MSKHERFVESVLAECDEVQAAAAYVAASAACYRHDRSAYYLRMLNGDLENLSRALARARAAVRAVS